jgi:hypothetical protein
LPVRCDREFAHSALELLRNRPRTTGQAARKSKKLPVIFAVFQNLATLRHASGSLTRDAAVLRPGFETPG